MKANPMKANPPSSLLGLRPPDDPKKSALDLRRKLVFLAALRGEEGWIGKVGLFWEGVSKNTPKAPQTNGWHPKPWPQGSKDSHP